MWQIYLVGIILRKLKVREFLNFHKIDIIINLIREKSVNVQMKCKEDSKHDHLE